MLKHLRTLKKEFLDKDIYIWDVSKRAIWTLTYLAYRGIPVKGFVTDADEFLTSADAGNTILGLPVISAEEFSQRSDAILAFDDETPKKIMEEARKYGEGFRLCDMFDWDPALYERSHTLYGEGAHAWTLIKKFAAAGIEVDGFIVTEKNDDMPGEILGLPVRQFDPARPNEAASIILTAASCHAPDDIPALLEGSGFTGDLYIEQLNRRVDMWSADPFIILDRAMKEERRVLLCCREPMAGELLKNAFALFGITPAKYVTPDEIYSLADEDPEKSSLIVHSFDRKVRFECADAAKALGFSPEFGNFSATEKSCYDLPMASGIIDYEYDELLEVSIDYTPLGGLPGWAVYGDEARAKTRIMVLGGSTTTDVFRFENWASKFEKICRANGKKVVVYNGARERDGATEEMLRLTRDIRRIGPDIVITLSGLNDTGSPADKFGKFRDESVFEYWKRTEGYIRLIAEAEGASFYCFLQPINGFMPEPDLEQNMMFVTDTGFRGQSFMKNSKGGGRYYDLLRLFHEEDGMFVDQGHYSEKASQIIAELIYDTVFRGAIMAEDGSEGGL